MSEIRRVSFSKVNTFNTCQRKYRYIYVDKVKRPPSSALIFGSSGHETQEFAYKEQLDGKARPTVETQKEFFADVLDKNIETGVEYGAEDDRDKLQAHGIKAITDYDKIGLATTPIGVETEVKFSGEGFELVGRLDLETEREIVDLKFGKRTVNTDDPQIQLQTVIYNRARRLQTGKAKDLKIHSFNRTLVRDGVRVLDVVPYLSESRVVSHIVETVRSIDNAERSGDFPMALNGMVCSWCQYKDLCGLPSK